MALLKHRATNGLHTLSSRYIAGRSPDSNLRLSSLLASSTHAEILWTGSSWELRDLGSRNGTFVGERRLTAGERVTIRNGTRIAFGDIEDLFELIDDGPPAAVAISDHGQRRESEDGLLVLPHADDPALTVFDEGGGNWVAESSDGTRRRVASGDTLRIAAHGWRIELPVVPERTWQPGPSQLALRRLTMRFAVSRDEEHVQVSLLQDNQVVVLPSRAHHYLVLTLARARLTDRAAAHGSEAEAGWLHVDELLDMLRTSETTLNVAICRARQDLARADVFGATELIERHPATRRLRLGVQNLEIVTI